MLHFSRVAGFVGSLALATAAFAAPDAALRKAVSDKHTPLEPEMGGEDFAQYGRTVEKVPISLFRIGVVAPEKIAAALDLLAPKKQPHNRSRHLLRVCQARAERLTHA